MNTVQITGNLTQRPEQRETRSETTVAQMRVAVPRPRKNGEDQGADFVDVTVFGTQADNCLRYLTKGRKIAVEGRLHHSEWDSDTGRRQKLEVVARFVEFLNTPANTRDTTTPAPVAIAVGAEAAEDEEDIPF